MIHRTAAIFICVTILVSCAPDKFNEAVHEDRKPATTVHEIVKKSDEMPASGKLEEGPDAMSGATVGETGGEWAEILENFYADKLVAWQKKTIASERNKPVHVVYRAEAYDAAFELMESLSPSLRPDLPVLIKPNLGGFTWFSKGADNGVIGRTTDLAFIEGVVAYLEKRGVKQISIAESWGVKNPKDVERLFEVSGLRDLANRHPAVKLVDMNYYGEDVGVGTPPVAVPIPGASILKDELVLPKVYVDHLLGGLVINLPKLKTHRLAVITAGMKNLMGVLGIKGSGLFHLGKYKMHKEVGDYMRAKHEAYDADAKKEYIAALDAFSTRLVDAFEATRPHITLIDGVLATQGDGFDKTSSVPMTVAIGSYNTVYADVVATKLAGLWDNDKLSKFIDASSPPYLIEALKRFYGSAKVADEIKVFNHGNNGIEDVTFGLMGMGPFQIASNTAKKLSRGGVIHAPCLGATFDSKELLAKLPVDRAVWITSDWAGTPLPPGVTTGVACGYTNKELVVLFKSRIRELAPIPEAPSKKDVPDLFKGDVVEIFIDPDPATPNSYYELEASPAGEHLDLAVDLSSKSFDNAYESNMRITGSVNKEHNEWTALITIPFDPKTIPAPKTGDKWRINFFRTEGKNKSRLYMAWNPTGTEKPKFHIPEKFGTMVFEN